MFKIFGIPNQVTWFNNNRRRVLIIVLLNTSIFPYTIYHWGGNGLMGGYIDAGHYFVQNVGVVSEVSKSVYYFSIVHAFIFFLTNIYLTILLALANKIKTRST